MPAGPAARARPHQATSPTRGHYLLLMAVLAVAGFTATALTYNEVRGVRWAQAMDRCLSRFVPSPANPDDDLRRMQASLVCSGPAERERGAAGFAGGAAVVAVALVLTWWLPRRYLRRLGPTGPAPAGWPDPGVPVLLGPPRLIEAFTIHHRGRPHIVMPRGARRRPIAEVEAVLRHECGHIRAADVRLVWLIRGLRLALPAVAVIPLVVTTAAAATGSGRSILGSLTSPVWIDYAVRIGVLSVAAWIIAARIGRAREHEADDHAVADGSEQGLVALLRRAGTRPRTRRERIAGTHPTPAQRLDHLGPGPAPAVLGRLDEAVAAVLAAVVLSATVTVTVPAFTATPLAPWTAPICSLAAALLLAVTCGPAWWYRQPWADDASWWQRTASHLGVPAGSVVGLFVGTERTGVTTDSPFAGWWTLLTVPLALTAATAICMALGGLWRQSEQPRRWPIPIMTTTILYGLAFWIGTQMPIFVAFFPPSMFLAFMDGAPWTPAIAVTALAGCVFVWRRHRRPRLLSPAVVALSAVAAAVAAAVVRLLMVSPWENDDVAVSPLLDKWSAASAGLTVGLVILVAAGIPDMIRAVVPATLLTAAVIYLRWAGEWKEPMTAARGFLTGPLAVVAPLVMMLVTVTVLLPARTRPVPRGLGYLLPVVSAIVTAAVTALLIMNAGSLDYEVRLSG